MDTLNLWSLKRVCCIKLFLLRIRLLLLYFLNNYAEAIGIKKINYIERVSHKFILRLHQNYNFFYFARIFYKLYYRICVYTFLTLLLL